MRKRPFRNDAMIKCRVPATLVADLSAMAAERGWRLSVAVRYVLLQAMADRRLEAERHQGLTGKGENPCAA